MLFDTSPKDNRKDFFDREKEIEKLKELRTPITLVLGLRRTGKSSLIKVSLNELNIPYIYLDLRKFEEESYISYKDFLLELQSEINRLYKRFTSILDFLKSIKGVSVMGNEIRFSWKREKVRFSDLLDMLEESFNKFIIVFDEAQELIKLRGINLTPVLAYVYDNLKNVKIIMSGSEMGLLYDFLKIEDPSSPLFGRFLSTVELKPFARHEAISFLKRGFDEVKIEFKDYDTVYETIGGIPGWLTYFGSVYLDTRNLKISIDKTLDYAKRLILREFENFLKGREVARKRYFVVMRTLVNCGKWSDVKHALEAEEGIEISDSEIHNYLRQLIRHSWIIKEGDRYCPAEPLIGYTFKASAF
ncbi:ATP-binding protein [Sulfolobus sp. S-194]|uniref:AAA family ATPase n=1 Tax=Sulfolobus sp. S-194 TaxID=2512240 RepID=UPI001437067B|nr:ATP-binding protein [Sulfolobus sp. S-194]QIW24547.1 ATP-binding protein [Sulfolobus sp. S-194]